MLKKEIELGSFALEAPPRDAMATSEAEWGAPVRDE